MGSTGSGKPKELGIKNVTMPDGTEIELEDELEYGTDTGKGRLPQTVTDFENKRKKAKIEYDILTRADGTVIESNKGGKRSVRSTVFANALANITSHNHPRSGDEAGILGGTFSPQDISNFMRFPNQTTLRAVAGEGTYSITKTPGLKQDTRLSAKFATDFRDFERDSGKDYDTAERAAYSVYRSIQNSNNSDVRLGKMDWSEASKRNHAAYEDYMKEVCKAQNRQLIRMHKWLIDNQKKYGYTYGLER